MPTRPKAAPAPAASRPTAAPSPVPAPSAPRPARFSISSIDKTADACTDFFQYACGNWIKANPIPPDQSRWSTLTALADRHRQTLRSILDTAMMRGPDAPPNDRMLADFYGSCMDEPSLERLGAAPIRKDLERIASLSAKSQIGSLVAALHTQGVPAFFTFGSEQDFKDTTRVLAIVRQGGLGLPDRDSYFRNDPRSRVLREQYVLHVTKMLSLLGDTPAAAKTHAEAVIAIETALAKNALDSVAQRDPNNVYHLMKVAEVEALMPAFDFKSYLNAIGTPEIAELNVTEPEFMKGMNSVIADRSLASLQAYLRWHVVHAAAPFLSAAFANENFDFYGKTLVGAKELRPRWKRCVDATDDAIGDALGASYVAKTFDIERQRRTSEVVANLMASMSANIVALDWMSDATKGKAFEKLKAVGNKIGVPEKWKSYSAVKVVAGDLIGNVQRARAFAFARELAKIGKPVDRTEFAMTASTVNGVYSPLRNDINFPIGILQPPFFDLTMDSAVNYGAIGGIIGHELTHGFDDQGSHFGASGNLENWWTDEDKKAFEERTSCMVDQYSGYATADGAKQDGAVTLSENVADNGGVRVAYMALVENLKTQRIAPIEGFTPQQRFFLAWGQAWCGSARPEAEALQVHTGPDSLPRYRVNGVVSNMPEFAEAFQCRASSPMVRGGKACRVW